MEPNPVIIAATAKQTASVSFFIESLAHLLLNSEIKVMFLRTLFQLIFLHGLGDTGLVLLCYVVLHFFRAPKC